MKAENQIVVSFAAKLQTCDQVSNDVREETLLRASTSAGEAAFLAQDDGGSNCSSVRALLLATQHRQEHRWRPPNTRAIHGVVVVSGKSDAPCLVILQTIP